MMKSKFMQRPAALDYDFLHRSARRIGGVMNNFNFPGIVGEKIGRGGPPPEYIEVRHPSKRRLRRQRGKTKAAGSKWTVWNGGPSPCYPNDMVDVVKRSGRQERLAAGIVKWEHSGGCNDTIKYRKAK